MIRYFKIIVVLSILSYNCFSQSYINYVTGRYSVIASWNNGVNDCPSVLDLIPDTQYPGCVWYGDSCFVNNWELSDPWNILVNADSSMIGCYACGTGTVAAVGKLYPNDSIYLKVKVFGNNWQYRDFKGFKLYSTTTKVEELSLPENALLLSPNPASDVLYVQSTQQNFMNALPVVYDMNGNKLDINVNYINSHTYKIDASSLAAGIYFVFVQSSMGYLKKKLVVNR